MQTSLFRRQAVDQQKNHLLGEVLVLPSVSHLVVAIALSLWVLAVILYLATGRYTRQETVVGWLESPSGVVRVYPDETIGKVKAIYVKNGDAVAQGQPLIMIDGDRTLTSGSSLESTLADEYLRQQKLLEEQLQRGESIQQMRTDDLEMRSSAIAQDLVRLDMQIVTVEKRTALVDNKILGLQAMQDSGHIASTSIDDLHAQRLSLQSDIQALQRDKIRQKNVLHQFESRLAIMPEEQRNNISTLESRLSELRLKMTQLNGQRSYIIKAVRAGLVTNMQAKLGQRVAADKPLLSVVPQGTDIEATLLVPVRAVGFIKPGQALEVRYDAFPYQKFGLYKGHIVQISDSIILPSEVHSAPISINEPAYLVRAKLSSNYVNAYGKQLSLKSGMTLSADVNLSDRSLLEWILEPLFSLQGTVQ